MQVTFPPVVDDHEIVSMVGDTSFKRGRTYARKAHVFDIGTKAESLELSGKVQGNRKTPYRTKIRFRLARARITPDFGICSCPVHQDCKHVAALLLASNEALHPPVADSTILRPATARNKGEETLPGMPEMKPVPTRKPQKTRDTARKQSNRPASSSSADQMTKWQAQLRSLVDPHRRPPSSRGYGAYGPQGSAALPLHWGFSCS